MKEGKMTDLDNIGPTGPLRAWDHEGALQFCLLFTFGLRAWQKTLDFGCGNLRLGRLLIPYLNKDNYYGIEPAKEKVIDGIKDCHLRELIGHKSPHFRYSADCNMAGFGVKFDYIIAYGVFMSMPINQILACLKSARNAMHSNSIFLATYLEGKIEERPKEWHVGGAHYRHETVFNLIHDSGLLVTEINWPASSRQIWLLIKRPS